MTWVFVGLFLAAAAVAIFLVTRQSELRTTAKDATVATERTRAELVAAREEAAESRRALQDAQVDAHQARSAIAHAESRAALAEAGLAFARTEAASSTASAQLEAVWSLTCLDEDRAWRLTMALPEAGENERVVGLASALEHEVARIREETGTPGELHLALPPGGLAPGDALVTFVALRGLAGLLTRYSDTYRLEVAVDEAGHLTATLACESFDGPDQVADEVTALLRALGPAGGELDLNRDAGRGLAARLRLPLAGP